MSNSIIQGLWIGEELSLIEQLCIISFLKNGHIFHLYTYSNVKNIPDGTIVCDANDIIPEDKIFYTHKGSVAHFADLFRWELLYKIGGYWVDMDIIALKPLNFNENIVYGNESFFVSNIAVLKFPPKNELVKHMVDRCKRPNKIRFYDSLKIKIKKIIRMLLGNNIYNIGWGEAGGPSGFKKALCYYNIKSKGMNYMYFYPISFPNWKHIFDNTYGEFPEIINNSTTIHLWNEAIRRDKNFNVETDYSPNSIFAFLLKRYSLIE